MSEMLLNYLVEEMGCFISDLKTASYQSQATALLKGLIPEEYAMDDWNEVFRYLYDCKEKQENYGQVRNYLGNL